jgi:hypothetical protein
MLSFLKIGMTILGLTLILIGVGAVFAVSQSGRVAKGFVETELKEILSTEVEIADMRVLPFRRAIELTGLRVMNPEGFKEGKAFQCERILILVDLTAVFSDVHIIEELSLEGMEIRYRVEVGEGTNIGRLAKAAQAAGEDEAPGFIVKSVRCDDAEVHLSTNVIPLSSAGMNLASIHLEDLNDSHAISAGEVTSILLRSLLNEIVTLDGLLDPVVNPLVRELKELKEKLVGQSGTS